MADQFRFLGNIERRKIAVAEPTIPGPTTSDTQRTFGGIAENPAGLNDTNAIFANSTTGLDVNLGTMASPVQTLQRAQTLTTPGKRRIVITGVFRNRLVIGSPFLQPGQAGIAATKTHIISSPGHIAQILAPNTYGPIITSTVRGVTYVFIPFDGDYGITGANADLAYFFGNELSAYGITLPTTERRIHQTLNGYEVEAISNNFDEIVGGLNTARYCKRIQYCQNENAHLALILRGQSEIITAPGSRRRPQEYGSISKSLTAIAYPNEIQIPDSTTTAPKRKRLTNTDWYEYALDLCRNDRVETKTIAVSWGFEQTTPFAAVTGGWSGIPAGFSVEFRAGKLSIWRFDSDRWQHVYDQDAIAWLTIQTGGGPPDRNRLQQWRLIRAISAGENYYIVQYPHPIPHSLNFDKTWEWPMLADGEGTARMPFIIGKQGLTWETWNPFPWDDTLAPFDIAFYKDRYYAVAADGIYVSDDGIESWAPIITWPKYTPIMGIGPRFGIVNDVLFCSANNKDNFNIWTGDGINWNNLPTTAPGGHVCNLAVGINGRVVMTQLSNWQHFQEAVINEEEDVYAAPANFLCNIQNVDIQGLGTDNKRKCGALVTVGRIK